MGDEEEGSATSYLSASDKNEALRVIKLLSQKDIPNSTNEFNILDEDLHSFEALAKVLAPFQEQPQILGPHMSDLLVPLNHSLNSIDDVSSSYNSYQLHLCCKTIQLLCRVRGYKYVMKLLPHEVHHIEICMNLLVRQVLPSIIFSFSSKTLLSIEHGRL